MRALLARERIRVEAGKTKIATKMHDEVSQNLTVLTMELALLQSRLCEGHPETTTLSTLLELVGGVNRAVRQITSELHPKMLDEFGLAAALQSECRRMREEHGAKVALETDVPEVPLASAVAIEVFRLFQEITSIVVSHAKTNEVAVGVRVERNILLISVTASGRGLNGNQLRDASSLEMLGLCERAHWIGGRLESQDRSDGGMAVTFHLPVQLAKVKTSPTPSQSRNE